VPRDVVVLVLVAVVAVAVVLRAAVSARECSRYRVVRVPVRAEVFDVTTYARF
jgi:hypothetical protein